MVIAGTAITVENFALLDFRILLDRFIAGASPEGCRFFGDILRHVKVLRYVTARSFRPSIPSASTTWCSLGLSLM